MIVMAGHMHHAVFLPDPMDSILIVKEQVLAAEGSVSHQRIRLSFDTPSIAVTGSITMVLQSTCLSGSSQD